MGKEGSSAGGPGGKGSNSILDLAEGKQDPEPTSLSKDMQREGGVHEAGPAEPALVRVRQATRKNTGPGLQPCLPASPFSSHLRRILRALPGDRLHILATGATGKRACAV